MEDLTLDGNILDRRKASTYANKRNDALDTLAGIPGSLLASGSVDRAAHHISIDSESDALRERAIDELVANNNNLISREEAGSALDSVNDAIVNDLMRGSGTTTCVGISPEPEAKAFDNLIKHSMSLEANSEEIRKYVRLVRSSIFGVARPSCISYPVADLTSGQDPSIVKYIDNDFINTKSFYEDYTAAHLERTFQESIMNIPDPIVIRSSYLNPNDVHKIIRPEEVGLISDGYHSFNELYDHRAKLFSVICNTWTEWCWKSLLHDDGTMYDGMFIVGIDTPAGMATYHYDVTPYWDLFSIKVLEKAPVWDGHTPAEAIERILSLI